jgi:hypothetical protein
VLFPNRYFETLVITLLISTLTVASVAPDGFGVMVKGGTVNVFPAQSFPKKPTVPANEGSFGATIEVSVPVPLAPCSFVVLLQAVKAKKRTQPRKEIRMLTMLKSFTLKTMKRS